MAFECQQSIEVFEQSELGLGSSCPPEIEPSQVDFELGAGSSRVSEQTLDSETTTLKAIIPSPNVGLLSNSKGIAKTSGSETRDAISVPRRFITDLPSVLICEVLDCLGPKELGLLSCVSTDLHRLASEHHVWKEFYCKRWGLPSVPEQIDGEKKSWKDMFVEKDFRSRSFLGRYSLDVLYGHTEPVRAVSLLSSAKLVFTSGYDSIVRMWDLEEGLSIASSQPLGCTVRAIAADTKLLVVGSTDGFIHGWKAVDGSPHLFDLRASQSQKTQFRLWEHAGPVTSVALDLTRMYSGSWDMTVRIWDRVSLKCNMVLRHSDWVWGLVPHGTTVASSAGSDVYVWDTMTGDLATIVQNAHAGYAYSLARSQSGNFLFTGGADGSIHMFEIFDGETGAVKLATWKPHAGAVYSLAFEFPWLVSASSDGKMSLIDIRKLVRTGREVRPKRRGLGTVEPPQRMLHGFGSNLFSVGIGSDRIVCGGEEGVVRIWNFTEALENERRARAMRGLRIENRMRRRRLLLEINAKGGIGDKCSVAAKKGSVNVVWRAKRGSSSKLKA